MLSGGSGQRLWPLSNAVRSKQFLKVLRSPNGTPESMIQRVYRQLRETGIDDSVIVSTVENQKYEILRQLGNKIELVVEPERRDTFPAIALASMYLYTERYAGLDDTVLIMPVDAYAESPYFTTLKTIDTAVQNNIADLVLMGIMPTYPSSKYGYIMPGNKLSSVAMKVQYFVEKPDEIAAEKLILDGALWNGGVFGFRLRWMIDLIRKYVPASNYQELQKQYSSFRKTSFDYEIVEPCDSLAVVCYNGDWKDLGTWNTLSDVMQESYAGNVISGEGTENTHIINELDIPIVALGIHDAVITATPDGILITNKNDSIKLKEYVAQIQQRPMAERRSWGGYKVLNYMEQSPGNYVLTKHLWIDQGKNLSYQRHRNRDEIWTIVDGTGKILLDGIFRDVTRGDIAYIKRGQLHSMKAITTLHMIEVQIGTELSEEDIERFPWDWSNN